ncbi:Hypothetical predicted protein [Cloeon dipterum]|uniref:Uncharacterized protein n=1 Tax=Cloeon dipterum TaxID=197152 RepID=A0A8S1C0C7_9INSE|nr:Hypothetical predicted protein [Cloeon dipterum]
MNNIISAERRIKFSPVKPLGADVGRLIVQNLIKKESDWIATVNYSMNKILYLNVSIRSSSFHPLSP